VKPETGPTGAFSACCCLAATDPPATPPTAHGTLSAREVALILAGGYIREYRTGT